GWRRRWGKGRGAGREGVKRGGGRVVTLYVLTAMLLDEVKPSELSWSKATASALPMRSYTMRNPPRKGLLFSPRRWLSNVVLELGDQAKETAGAKLFQSCG